MVENTININIGASKGSVDKKGGKVSGGGDGGRRGGGRSGQTIKDNKYASNHIPTNSSISGVSTGGLNGPDNNIYYRDRVPAPYAINNNKDIDYGKIKGLIEDANNVNNNKFESKINN